MRVQNRKADSGSGQFKSASAPGINGAAPAPDTKMCHLERHGCSDSRLQPTKIKRLRLLNTEYNNPLMPGIFVGPLAFVCAHV